MGQVLLAPLDFSHRGQYLHARGTLEALQSLGVVPIVNENDAVADEEIRFGDNDRLAALVANLVGASHLVLLTDTEGLFTADPRLDPSATLIEEVTAFDADLVEIAGASRSGVGSGGMASKLAAARMASWSGVTTVIAPAHAHNALRHALSGAAGFGTTFHPRPERLSARKSWIAFAVASHGSLHINQGALQALENHGRSLLRVGVESHDGTFAEGDAVDIKGPDGQIVAKGLVRVSAEAFGMVTTSSSTATTSCCFVGSRRSPLACSDDDERIGATGPRRSRRRGRARPSERRPAPRGAAPRCRPPRTGDRRVARHQRRRELDAYRESGAGRDRLLLTEARVASMASALREIADAPDPLFETLDASTRPNGLRIERLRVPLGVIGVVYENRPNVTSDVAGLCIRSGNAAYLRGSSTALSTNRFIVSLWHEALEKEGLPSAAVSLVEDTSHETATAFMQMTDVLDCLIPRGGPSLIAAMREHARVPYVLDGDGNCHVYVDESADLDQAVRIVRNAKMSRPGVCNAAETVLVHRNVAERFLPALAGAMPEVELRGDDATREVLPGATPATEEDYGREFLDLILAVRVVDSLDEAIAHVGALRHRPQRGDRHGEPRQRRGSGCRRVDAAAVLVNASTRFIDGGELGLGGEVGISTQKLHARGPMGLRELTCLKWVVRGEGQIR